MNKYLKKQNLFGFKVNIKLLYINTIIH